MLLVYWNKSGKLQDMVYIHWKAIFGSKVYLFKIYIDNSTYHKKFWEVNEHFTTKFKNLRSLKDYFSFSKTTSHIWVEKKWIFEH